MNRRDIGITIMNDDEIYPVNYYAGIFNGAGPLFNRYGTYNSEEATVGCPVGKRVAIPVPSPGRLSANSRNLNANFRDEIDKIDVCGATPMEHSRRRPDMVKEIWSILKNRRWPVVGDWPITPASILVPTMRSSASIWRI